MEALHMRQCEVIRAMHPAADHEIGTLIAAMFLGFPTLRLGPDEARRTAQLYVSQLREFPAWAVKRACERILQDKVSGRNPDFSPSVAVVVAECRELVRDLQAEKVKLARVLDADVYHEPTADEKAAVKAGYEKLIADLRLNDPFAPSAKGAASLTRDESAARLEALKECPEPLPAMSPGLAKLMGLSPAASMPGAAE